MVHGFDYAVQYEIKLINSVDLYEIILPICSELRTMLKYNITEIDKINKLIIIPHNNLKKRFEEKEYTRPYIHSRSSIRYNGSTVDRINNSDIYKYYDVKVYSDYVNNKTKLPEPISIEMYKTLENKYNYLINMYEEDVDYITKYSEEERLGFNKQRIELDNILKIQRILLNIDYYNEISKIYENLINIELTTYEIELINKVLLHPSLNGLIFNHGLCLVDYYC